MFTHLLKYDDRHTGSRLWLSRPYCEERPARHLGSGHLRKAREQRDETLAAVTTLCRYPASDTGNPNQELSR